MYGTAASASQLQRKLELSKKLSVFDPDLDKKIRDWQLRIGKINSYYLYGTASPPLKKKTVDPVIWV
jgi:hypothetical protein